MEPVVGPGLHGEVQSQDGVSDTLIPPHGVTNVQQHLDIRELPEDLLVEVGHRIVNTSYIVSQKGPPAFSGDTL